MSDLWQSFRRKGRIVDDGIKRLDKQWETPHIFISKYGELVKEASKHLENFLESIKNIHDEIIEDNQPRDNYVTDVYRFSDECTNIYEGLRQQVYEIEGLLTEFGYEGLPQLTLPRDPDDKDSSILKPEMMESLEITDEYSQDIKDEQENISPNKSKKVEMVKFIATPVIKSLASLKKEISDTTPLTASSSSSKYPQEPTYSPYYYKA